MKPALRLLLLLGGLAALTPTAAFAQSAPAESGPATTTASGDTGIWFVPTGAVLPARQWSASFYRTNIDDGQGFSDISTFPITFAVGVGDRAEIFGSFVSITRIDRDARPLFFASTPAGTEAGTGGGIVVNHPLVRSAWTGNQVGDVWVGGKLNLLGASSRASAVAVRAMAKLPTGDTDSGVSTGKADVELDAIVSHFTPVAEVSAYGGVLVRGNPSGYSLTNGLRWGIGAAFPQRYNLGFRLNAELYGEKYFDNTITAPAGLTGADSSVIPTSTRLKSPAVASVGFTWQAPNGFFIGAAASWNVAMKGRSDAAVDCPPGLVCAAVVSAFPDTPKDDKGLQFRIGFHPGARGNRGRPQPLPPTSATATPSPTAPAVAAPPAAAPPAAAAPGAGGQGAPPPAAAANRPPTVRASCDPCTVEVGRSSTVSADAQDPDGDPLAYQWTTSTGSLGAPTSRQSAWTAPQQTGPVPVTVVVNDGRGGTARDTTTIQVIAARQLAFQDVYFEFDRSSLRPDAVKILEEAVAALQGNPGIRLTIEGHTCSIGTPEYNLALGDRRALAVKNYLMGRGIPADRLITVSFGEERPKFDNSREETRRQNRRAGIVVQPQ
jgi:outer membrane protein OmpA-like peptidoglycan-associated protein